MKKILTTLSLLLIITVCSAQVNPKDFGAKADGVTDDAPALYRAIAYCLSFPQYQTPELWLPAGVYRITRPLVIGGNAFKPADCFVNNLVQRYIGTSKMNLAEFQKGTYTAAMKIKGIGTVSIYADFNDTPDMQAAIVYQAAGDQRIATSTCQFTAELSNIGIYAKGSFSTDGKPQATVIPPYKTNNQVGLLCIYTTGLQLNNVSFWGFKEGMILNSVGLINAGNLKFDYCQRACYEIQNHSGKFENTSLWYCDKGFEVRSNQLIFEVYYARTCGVGLHVASSNNKFSSIYLESLNSKEAQLIIGDNPGEPNATTALINGVKFFDLTIVSKTSTGAISTGISWKENARRMSINGGEIQSCYFKYPAHELTKVRYEGVTGTLPSQVGIKLD